MDRWAVIRQRAADTLARYEAQIGHSVFVDGVGSYAHLEDIAHELFRLTVAPDDTLPTNISGQLDLDEGTIGYRPDHEVVRQRFTIAHEIGHAALDHPPRCVMDTKAEINEQPDVQSLTTRDGVYRAYNERDRWELEANVFAAELLMPLARVHALVKADPQWAVHNVAATFGVSKSAARNQLVNALLPGPPPPLAQPETIRTAIDPSQRQAAEAEGPTLVLAGPGAGKSKVLTERFCHLVNDRGVPPDRILVLTFSNKAAMELRDRLAALLPTKAHAIDVGTFHALGLQLLQSFGVHLGIKPNPRLLTDIDAFVLLRRRLGEVPLGAFADLYHPSRHLRTLQQAISRAKDELVDSNKFTQLAEEWSRDLLSRPEPDDEAEAENLAEERRRAGACIDVGAVYATYQSWLLDGGFLDYGDLIAEAVRLFAIPEVAAEIRGEWDYILVDEFQDINYASGRLVREIDGGRGVVWAVEDPRQSIYRFRGASPVNIREFTVIFPGAQVICLEWNYRSVEGIVRAGRAIDIPLPAGSDGKSLPVVPLRARRPNVHGESAVDLILTSNAADERAAITEQIKAESATHALGDVAILCRKNSQAQELAETLEIAGIPTDWGGALKDREAFKDIVGVLLLADDEPQGLVRLAQLPEHFLAKGDLRLLIAEARKRGNSALAALYAQSDGDVVGLSDEGIQQAQQLKTLAFALRRATTPWDAITAYLFEHATWPRTLLGEPTPAAHRLLATLGQVANLAREYIGRDTPAGGQDVASFLEFLRICLESGEIGNGGDLLVADDAVHILTVHRSKGLEWPVVIVPNLVDGRFPLGDHGQLPIPPGLVNGAATTDEALEEVCLFYVAATRARDRLILSHAEKYARAAKPAAFLRPLISALESTGDLQIKRVITGSPPSAATPMPPSVERWVFSGHVPLPALANFKECGQQFMYEQVYGLRRDEHGSLLFHKTVYAALSWLAERASSGTLPNALEVSQQVSRFWDESGLVGHWYEAAYRRWAERIVHSMAARLVPGIRLAIRRQATLHVGPANREVAIWVDEEEENSGIRIYRRYHFGQFAESHADDDRLYLLADLHQQRYGSAPYEVHLYYPLSGLDRKVDLSAKVITNRVAKAAERIEQIELGEFKPKPDLLRCPTCPFAFICPG